MRTCNTCGKPLTDRATFCPSCGAEAPVSQSAPPAQPPGVETNAATPRFCSACGAPLGAGARFCASCGATAGAATAVPSAPLPAPPDPTPVAPAPMPVAPVSASPLVAAPPDVDDEANAGPSRAVLIGAAVAVLLIALLFWFNRYEWLGMERPDDGNMSAAIGVETTMYAVANANLRDRASTSGSSVTGKLLRGSKVTGVLQLGEDNASQWFKMADGNYVSAVNLSASAPPALVRTINRRWYAAEATPLLAEPQAGSAVLETAEPGKAYQLVGLTAGGFAEVTLGRGGVGYFDASGIDLAAASTPPIAIAFTPTSCGYGNEVDMLLRKLGQDALARQQRAGAAAYPSDEARDNALSALETASSFLPLKRSFKGLSVGGIGTHYEASSIYFRDTPDKVIAVFAKDYPIGDDGSFAVDSEVSSSIQATSGDAQKYGQTELICGV